MKRAKDRLQNVLIIGATPSGVTAANKLGELGIPVTLVDADADLDRKLSNPEWTLDSGVPFNHAHRPGMIRILRNPGIQCILPAQVNKIKHSSQGFRVAVTREPTFVDAEKCILCGKCAEVCPVTVDGDHKAVWFESRLSLPGRPVIDKRQMPLCRENCPLGVNAQGYAALTKEGKYAEALALVREKNILPGICGRICTHPCETDCRRGQLDDPVAIRDIKRFLADWGAEHPDEVLPPEKKEARKEHFAVIGSGPSGLAAAAELAKQGCRVTIFEKEGEAGGMLRYGIGPHRLPRNILDAEFDYIQKMGVEIQTGVSVDILNDLENSQKDFDGVILCAGSWKDRPMGVPGENLKGVGGCLEFLNDFYRGKIDSLDGSAVVIGDGNAAFDLARTLKRIGADVTILSWFGNDEIPADPEEIRESLAEGITIKDRTQVVVFEENDGSLKSLRCRTTKPGPEDENGIAWPVIDKDINAFEMSVDRVFVAIGQMGPFPPGKQASGLTVTDYGFIAVNNDGQTDLPKVWAAGDSITGPSTVVHAMAGGKAVAAQVLKEICGIETPDAPFRPELKDFPEIPTDIPVQHRASMPEIQAAAREGGFAEVALGLSEEQIRTEAGRCLQCGVCSECMQCLTVCDAIGAVDHCTRSEEEVLQTGALIIADPEMAPPVKGDDVIRAYGPKSAKTDIYAMMTRGFASAAQALVLLGNQALMQKGNGISIYQPDHGMSDDIRIGVFACRCNDSLGWMPEMDTYIRELENQEDVIHAEALTSACVPDGIASILRTVREKGITRLVLASCVCCPLDFVCSACTDQRSRLKKGLFNATGLTRSMSITRNIRGEALSLLKKDPDHALERLTGLINRSVQGARDLRQYPRSLRLYNFTTAVIGGAEAEMTSAMTLARAGMDVFLFGAPGSPLKDAPAHPNIHAFSGSTVAAFKGVLGDFQLDVNHENFDQQMQVGAVVLGEKARKNVCFSHQKELECRVVMSKPQTAGVTGVPFFYPGSTSISGLFLSDPSGISVSKRQKGAAAAVLAAAAMPRGPRQSKGYTAEVNEELCRCCGRCVAACPYQAVTLKPNAIGGWCASVDEAFCKGCGNCISVCPSNAADSPFRNQHFFEQTLENILLP